MADTPARAVREAWAAGRPARNAWLTIPDAHLAEMVAARGATEAVTLDLQHGLFDRHAAVQAIRAVGPSTGRRRWSACRAGMPR